MQAIMVGFTLLVIVAVLGLLISIMPSLVPDSQFITFLDSAIAFLITFFDMARWFIPLNIFALCLTVMFAVDNFALISRIVQYLVKLVRG